MNSRSSVNESNLVNFSPDLASLNALDKEPLLSFPFDHLYACHSESSNCGQSLTLDKNVEISTHCLVQPAQTIQEKDAEILSLRSQNKRLKELLVYHLDLIQQQNDVITNREKTLTNVKNEVDSGHQESITRTTTSPIFSLREPPPAPSPESFSNDFNSVLLGTDTASNSFIKPFGHDPFDMGRPSEALPDLLSSDMTMPTLLDSPLTPLNLQSDFNMIQKLTPIKKEIDADIPREAKYTVTTNSGSSVIRKIQRNSRRKVTALSSLRRSPKMPKQEPSTIYDNEIISASKKAKMMSSYGSSKLNPLRYPFTGSLSDRLQLIDTTPTGEDPYQIGEAEMREQSPIPRLVLPKNNRVRVHTAAGFEIDSAGAATVGNARRVDPEPKSKKTKKPSKIKTNRKSTNAHPQITLATVSKAINASAAAIKTEPIKKEKDWVLAERPSKKPRQTSLGDFSYGETSANLASAVSLAASPDLQSNLTSSANLMSPSDRTSNSQKSPAMPSTVKRLPSANLTPSADKVIMSPMDITKMNFTEIFQPESGEDSSSASTFVLQNTLMNDIIEQDYSLINIEPSEATAETTVLTTPAIVTPPENEVSEPETKKRGSRTASAAGSSTGDVDMCVLESHHGSDSSRGLDSKRGRKRALSSASTTSKAPPKRRAARGGRGGYRGKRGSWIPVPTLTTRKPYHTALGHPDISWYLGHDPDIKKEDVEQLAENTSPNVEVPRWREMIFTSLESADGTENTDDEAYRKRHQKLEAEERRQLRWHMRRVREQRQVERLRLRQRDPWAVSTLSAPPAAYTVWPSPLRDLHTIEITDVLPVLAFGENIPMLPDINFQLPWMRLSKAQKRGKRAKTLH